MFDHIDPYPGDPILSLMQTFSADPRPHKVNLGVGVYYDEQGHIPVLPSVQQATKRLNTQTGPATYLPMEGLASYRQAVVELIFGKDHPALQERRVATIQSIGGSGALRVGADFLKKYFPESEVWVSDPTWENHYTIFSGIGFKVHTYPYYDATNNRLKVDEMLETLAHLPERSIVLIQACCHNPTGVDLSQSVAKALITVVKQRQLIPFIDMAYQGFSESVDEDAWVVRELANAGLDFLVAQSFSKNFSLYGERVGTLSAVTQTPTTTEAVFGQLQAAARRTYSTPPRHGAHIVATVLGDEVLKERWMGEIEHMRQRILQMRSALKHALEKQLSPHCADYLTEQRGMFSYTGLSPQQVDTLRERDGVYLIRSGRLCVAGLNEGNVDYVARSLAALVEPVRN